MKCQGCEDDFEEEEMCGDHFCRDCHKSLSFEDCMSGLWVDQQRIAGGLPAVGPLKKKMV